MLVIRREQMDAFRNQPRLAFESEMAAYLKRYFPFEAANADLPRWVQSGLDRAAQYEFATYNESAQYLALMAILGAGFDEDPQIPWAAEMIGDSDNAPEDRITRVFDRAIEFLDAISGPNCSWFVRAKIRVKNQDMSILNQMEDPAEFAARIREILVDLYPQKAAVIGEPALEQLVNSAVERSANRGQESATAALIHAVHMYYLGSEFDQDACYPWAGATLADPSGGSVEERYAHMHQLSIDYLDRSFQFKG
jgi:hypothetical protein